MFIFDFELAAVGQGGKPNGEKVVVSRPVKDKAEILWSGAEVSQDMGPT